MASRSSIRLPSGVPYVSIDGETGLTVPPGDAKKLADAINTLATDRELRERLGSSGRERVEKYFNEKNVIKQLYSVLSEGTGRKEA